jgi:hypothetical protein
MLLGEAVSVVGEQFYTLLFLFNQAMRSVELAASRNQVLPQSGVGSN